MAPLANNRDLPYSAEAEEYLLSCCLIDGGEVVARCTEAKVTPESFYIPAHGIIFSAILGLQERQIPIDLAVLGEELKKASLLDSVGGYAFLTHVSGSIPTTMQAGYFIGQVHEYSLRRKLIRSAKCAQEKAYNPSIPIEGIIAELWHGMHARDTSLRAGYEFPWDALLAFDKNADPECLMGKRFLGRTSGVVIVAPSGVGKSVLALQVGACAALKRPFFGLQMAFPMRVLYIQAEDDLGDVAEAAQGFVEGYALSNVELTELRERLRIVRWNDTVGTKFLLRLHAEHRKWPFDLVIINPLFSFCGCNVSEQRDMSSFLRNGLNPILNDTRSAAAIVHHTNKPPTDPNNQPSDLTTDLRYLGSGSAELTNWARAYITLQPVRSAGDKVHKMVFAKRGHRAGIVNGDGKPTTSIFIEHSQAGLCWVPSNYRPENSTGGKFQPRFELERARRVYDPKLTWRENEKRIAEDQDMTTRAVRRHRRDLEAGA